MVTEGSAGGTSAPLEPARPDDFAVLARAAESLLLTATDEQDVATQAVEHLADHFGSGTRGILLFDPERDELRMAAVAGRGAEIAAVRELRVRLGEGLVGSAALYRMVLNVPDVNRDSRYIALVPDVASEICLPIVARESLLGVLVVESPRPATFSEHDELVLTSFAHFVALALLHVRTHAEKEQLMETARAQLAELEALHELTQRAASVELGEALHATVEVFQRLTKADATAIYLWESGADALELAALIFDERVYPGDYRERVGKRIPLGVGMIGWVAQHRQPLLIGDLGKDPRPRALPGLPLDNKAGIVVPIMARERFLGVIRATKMGAHSLGETELRRAQTLAGQAALLLAAAEANRDQRARLHQLGVLHSVSLNLSQATTLEAALEAVLTGALQATDAEAGAIWRHDHESFQLAVARNLDHERLVAIPPDPASSLTSRMLRTGRPVILADIQVSGSESWRRRTSRMRSLVGVPLRSEGDFYGSLFVLHSRADYFRPEHARNLEVLAVQAAAALARARAFEEARRLAITDELTGLFNGRHFTVRLGDEVRRAQRYGHALALTMLDSDSLKMVNDRFGHEEGNRHLVELAKTIREHVRATDTAFRFGGDEFLILHPETQLREAVRVADRIRIALRAHPFRSASGETAAVSVSAGVATYPGCAKSPDDLFRQADAALYLAKGRGKNGVVSAMVTSPSQSRSTPMPSLV
jgi:diguanylate cyclase (GGDEF)-like protein